jgi:prepilin-type N-terminal cleavage/methylation domain-containing protein
MRHPNRKGFGIIELLVVIAIIGWLYYSFAASTVREMIPPSAAGPKQSWYN